MAFAARVKDILRRRAPGLVLRVRAFGPVSGTLDYINPAHRFARGGSERQVERLVARMSPEAAARTARGMQLDGDVEQALAVLKAAIAKSPDDGRLLLERARVLYKLDRPGFDEDLTAALAGDVRRTTVTSIVTFAARTVDAETLAECRARAERATTDEQDRVRALATADLVLAYHRDDSLAAAIDLSVTPPTALVVVARKANLARNWRAVDELVATVIDRGGLESVPSDVLDKLARTARERGDVTRALVLAEAAAARDDRPRYAKFAAVCRDDATLLAEGWKRSEPRQRAAAEPGRVAYLLHNSLPHTSGGYATRSHGLLTGLAGRGWAVDAITRPGYPLDRPEGRDAHPRAVARAEVIDGVTYRRLVDTPTGGGLITRTHAYADAVARIGREQRWGVVHAASNHYNGLAAVEAAARLGVPAIYEVRGLWEITRVSRDPEYGPSERFALYEAMEAQACIMADHAFAITAAVRDIMVERGVPRDKIALLPNGVDVERFIPLTPDAALRSQLGLDGKVVIGYIGSVVDYEGLELVVQAVSVLAAEGLPVALMIVGDGDAMDHVRSEVERHGIEDITVMPGRVPHGDVESYYSIVDIAPFPRLPLPVTEAVSPLKPFEAMAMAKPVVVSSVAALLEIVTEGENGRIFTKGDAEDLARVLRELVEDEPARADLGAKARVWVEENRSWKTLSGRIDDVYAQLGVPLPAR